MGIKCAWDQYGFKWGGAHVQRLGSDDERGWVVLEVRSRKSMVQVYVTKTGKMRLHGADGKEIPLPNFVP